MECCISLVYKEGAAVPIPSPKSTTDCIALSFCGETLCDFFKFQRNQEYKLQHRHWCLPDIYTQLPKACSALGHYEDSHIRHTFGTLKI